LIIPSTFINTYTTIITIIINYYTIVIIVTVDAHSSEWRRGAAEAAGCLLLRTGGPGELCEAPAAGTEVGDGDDDDDEYDSGGGGGGGDDG